MEQRKNISGGKPFFLKGIQGIQHVPDARKAVELGVYGIIYPTALHDKLTELVLA